jgi:hypothetical protein
VINQKKLFFFLITILCSNIAFSQASKGGGPYYDSEKRTITRIVIKVDDVFDLSKSEENTVMGRTANFIHITTKESVVKNLLLFKEGDAVNSSIIYETERLLRDQSWVRDAKITLQNDEGGIGSDITAVVWVHDAWSLKGGLKFGSVGGDNTFRIRFHEVNFLGLGKTLMVGYEKNPERTIGEIEYQDPALFGSRWQLFAGYQKLSDGYYKKLKVEMPFYELKTPWSFGAEGTREKLNFKLYNEDHLAYEIPFIKDEVSIYYHKAFFIKEKSAFRSGIEFWSRQNLYETPYAVHPEYLPEPDLENRRLRGFVLYFGYFEDKFSTYSNIQATSKAEDFNLGTEATMHLGYFSKSLGGDRNAFYSDINVTKGFEPNENWLILTDILAETRREDGLYKNMKLNFKADFYNTAFKNQTLAASVEAFLGTRLDLENYVYIGGSDGLRGYPNHFKVGDRRWTLSAEDRITTNKTLWGVLQWGYVGYFDAGAVREIGGGNWTKTYANVGFGLRMGNLKSAFGHIVLATIAFPLVKGEGVDPYQIVFGNYIRF